MEVHCMDQQTTNRHDWLLDQSHAEAQRSSELSNAPRLVQAFDVAFGTTPSLEANIISLLSVPDSAHQKESLLGQP